MRGHVYVIACISLISFFRICSSQETFISRTCPNASHADADFRSSLLQQILSHFVELRNQTNTILIYLNKVQKRIDSDGSDNVLEWGRNVSRQMAVLTGNLRDVVNPGNGTGGRDDESMNVRVLQRHMAHLAEIFENTSLSRHLGLVSNSADHCLATILNATVSSSNSCSRLADLCEGGRVRFADELSHWRNYTAHQWQMVMRIHNYTLQYQNEKFYLRLKDLLITGFSDMQLSIANVSTAALAASHDPGAFENLKNESDISTWRNSVSEYMSSIMDTQRDNKGMLLHLVQMLEAGKVNFSTSVNSTTDVVEEIKLAYETVLHQTGFIQGIDRMREINIYMSPSFSATTGRDYYTGCQDARNHGHTEAGVYHIRRGRPEFRVWCEFDGNLGWAVIQRRFDGSVDFFRNFQDYEDGFGNLWGEYWLGLKYISWLSRRGTSLSIYMETFQHQRIWANYSSFLVFEAPIMYRLYVSGYSGTDRDSLSYHNNMAFSTWDQDQDRSPDSCAHKFYGGWWYKSCHESNLNGKYAGLESGLESDLTACSWLSATGANRRLMLTRMMVNS